MHTLVSHPYTPANGVISVTVELRSMSRHAITLRYGVDSAATLYIPETLGGPTDGLWQTTCFELFVKPIGGSAYREFNFAPDTGWAAYSFSDRRSDMMPIPLDHPPRLLDGRLDNRLRGYPDIYEFDVTIDRDSWPKGDAKLGLSAVIEEIDGTKSYWALRHPPGAPDFHHPDCFALELPARGSR